MKVIIALVAALACMQVMEARVRRDAGTTGADFNSLFEAAQRHFQNLTATIQNALPSQEEVRTQLQTHAQTFANNLQAAATQFNEKAAELSGDAQTAVRQAAQQLEQQVSNLRQQFPDGAQAADKLKASIESALAEEARRVQEAVQPHADAVAESLKTAARTAVEQATVITNQVQQSVQQAANAH
uniref:Apolipophorin-III n=1 Tax=Acheta domesticus TaxID=6997 RepID=Q16989_ACHDO|nr:apolipophorin-III [Acheta domesticus]